VAAERPAAEAAPYERIASFYDELMAHVDYELWADYLRDLWARHADAALAGVFDAACGTGRLLAALDGGVPERAGADRSAAMLAVARERLGPEVPLARADLRELAAPRRWSLASCLYDSVNYLLEPAGLELALRRLAALAEPRGLVVFDVCTERNSLDHFLDYRDEGLAGDWEYERHSWYDAGQRLHHNDFRVRRRDGGTVFRERHLQRIYRVAEVEDAVARAGLELLATYSGFGFRRGGERDDRVHFVARPRAGAPHAGGAPA